MSAPKTTTLRCVRIWWKKGQWPRVPPGSAGWATVLAVGKSCRPGHAAYYHLRMDIDL